MFCNQCGNEVPAGTSFCPNCGAPVEQAVQPPQYAQPQQPQPVYAQPMAPVGDPQERELAKSNLVFGILAIAFACTYYLSFMGIIFGAISGSKAKLYAASYPLTGKAKTGSILGKVGLILGIVLTALSLITIIACIVGIASESSSYYY